MRSRPSRSRASICSGPMATSSAGVVMSVYCDSAVKNPPTRSQSRWYRALQKSVTSFRFASALMLTPSSWSVIDRRPVAGPLSFPTLIGMRVLITGAARAIGEATANELTARGHHVVATARDAKLLDSVEAAQRLELDDRDDTSIRRALDECGELNASVNNAGISTKGPLEDYPLQRLQEAFDTNAIGPLRLLQPVLPSWRARGSGVIVNVSSVQGRIPTPLEGAYAASKHALEAISETLHHELGHFGIRVVIVEPGYIAPGMKDVGEHPGPGIYRDLWDQWDNVYST